MVKNTTCDRCGLKLSTYQKYQQHLNRKNPCRPKNPPQAQTENATPGQNAPQVGNAIPEQNQVPVPIPEGDLISFNENPPTHQPREASAPAVDPGIGSSTKRNKTILIYKNIPNGIEFYDKKRKWYGVKEDF
ncbi:3716_t:CDS:1, partial [Entrophospora sp. SA101]